MADRDSPVVGIDHGGEGELPAVYLHAGEWLLSPEEAEAVATDLMAMAATVRARIALATPAAAAAPSAPIAAAEGRAAL